MTYGSSNRKLYELSNVSAMSSNSSSSNPPSSDPSFESPPIISTSPFCPLFSDLDDFVPFLDFEPVISSKVGTCRVDLSIQPRFNI